MISSLSTSLPNTSLWYQSEPHFPSSFVGLYEIYHHLKKNFPFKSKIGFLNLAHPDLVLFKNWAEIEEIPISTEFAETKDLLMVIGASYHLITGEFFPLDTIELQKKRVFCVQLAMEKTTPPQLYDVFLLPTTTRVTRCVSGERLKLSPLLTPTMDPWVGQPSEQHLQDENIVVHFESHLPQGCFPFLTTKERAWDRAIIHIPGINTAALVDLLKEKTYLQSFFSPSSCYANVSDWFKPEIPLHEILVVGIEALAIPEFLVHFQNSLQEIHTLQKAT